MFCERAFWLQANPKSSQAFASSSVGNSAADRLLLWVLFKDGDILYMACNTSLRGLAVLDILIWSVLIEINLVSAYGVLPDETNGFYL